MAACSAEPNRTVVAGLSNKRRPASRSGLRCTKPLCGMSKLPLSDDGGSCRAY
ncbi:hypothetical protein BRADI_2g24863v3 [Brachypodium distachyon]|uniref:Uncharacterized protein n=1 Tax=Brachypodium distachyon TaxID=15368 RepID=A0A2K2DAB3_BRADI|nr:hypothetical protein BRADI_2g24863v3 [Brachypodium distachyon]